MADVIAVAGASIEELPEVGRTVVKIAGDAQRSIGPFGGPAASVR